MDMKEFQDISYQVEIRPFSSGYRIKDFSCGIPNYNRFLKNNAQQLSDMGISQTHLLINKTNGDVIGYMSLNSDSIKLLDEEKIEDSIDEIRFTVFPALKIGYLAIAKKYREMKIHYGSFLIEIAKSIVVKMNNGGIACRFIVVDADVTNKNEQGKDVTEFYSRNGFKFNKHSEYMERKDIVSMRCDVYYDEEDEQQVATE